MNKEFPQKYYYPQLNALRGIGVISVFLYHSYKPQFGTGFFMEFASFCYENIYLSMDMFFALSAFIITHLANIEIEKNGNFSFKNFMVRRVLRIWPIYFIILFLSYVVIKNLANYYGIPINLPPSSWYILFVSNFYLEGHVFFLRQLWTISVEEQFYIIWGICLLFFNKKLKFIIITFSLIGIIFSFYGAYGSNNFYYHSLTYLFDMMCGAYFAYLIQNKSIFIKYISTCSQLKSSLLYLFLPLFFLSYYFLNQRLSGVSNNILDLIMRLIFIIHHCMIFVDQMFNKNSIFNLSRRKFLIYVGKIAYGVYCFHGLVLTIGFLCISKFDININPLISALIMFGVTLLVGSVSYKYVEKPILNLKSKLQNS